MAFSPLNDEKKLLQRLLDEALKESRDRHFMLSTRALLRRRGIPEAKWPVKYRTERRKPATYTDPIAQFGDGPDETEMARRYKEAINKKKKE